MAKGCQEVMAGDINMPRFIWIDVGKKIMQNKKTGDNVRKSEIERIEVVDNKLILQGAEQGREDLRDGFGWTMAIMQDTGQLVLSASGDHVGDVIFGFCTPQ
jgi:hypothetical protein